MARKRMAYAAQGSWAASFTLYLLTLRAETRCKREPGSWTTSGAGRHASKRTESVCMQLEFQRGKKAGTPCFLGPIFVG